MEIWVKYLVLAGLPAWYLLVIAQRLYYHLKYYDITKAAMHTAALEGGDLDEYAKARGHGNSLWVFIPHCFVIGILFINGMPWYFLIHAFVLGAMAYSMARENHFLSRLITSSKAHAAIKFQARFQQNNFKSAFDNDGFDYEESAFSGRRSSAEDPAEKSAPRGFEDRHPDDAALWAILDDPSASDGERKNALSAILKRQAKRQANTEQIASA